MLNPTAVLVFIWVVLVVTLVSVVLTVPLASLSAEPEGPQHPLLFPLQRGND